MKALGHYVMDVYTAKEFARVGNLKIEIIDQEDGRYHAIVMATEEELDLAETKVNDEAAARLQAEYDRNYGVGVYTVDREAFGR